MDRDRRHVQATGFVDTTIKENSTKVQKAMGEREVRHMTEEVLDYPTRVKLERTVIKHLKNATEGSLPEDEASLRRKAVWFRQACYIAMSVNLGHRTGVYQNMTVDEFQRAVHTDEKIVITHVG